MPALNMPMHCAPMSANSHSGRFSDNTAIASPRRRPSSASASAMARVWSK
jgi:hypothetical protein